MISGVGIDMVSVQRLKSAVERWGDRFLNRIFTRNEIDYSYKRIEPYASLAARFAAKEAFIKAVGEKSVSYRDIEVSNRPDGSPFIKAGGRVGEVFSAKGISGVHLSMSHEKEFGIAFVVAEK